MSPSDDPTDDPRFAAIEEILMGRMPPLLEQGVDIGNTALSPAILATEFVIKSAQGYALFKQWMHANQLFPEAVEGIDLPEDALDRDLKVAMNGLLNLELTAKYVQDIAAQLEAESGQAGVNPDVPSA